MIAQYAIPLAVLMLAPLLLRLLVIFLIPWRLILRLSLATGGLGALLHWGWPPFG